MVRCALMLALFVSCAGNSDDSGLAEGPRCEQLRDHLVDIRLADAHVATGVDREAHRAAMKTSLGSEFVASCTGKLTESEVSCALRATDAAGAAACSSASATR